VRSAGKQERVPVRQRVKCRSAGTVYRCVLAHFEHWILRKYHVATSIKRTLAFFLAFWLVLAGHVSTCLETKARITSVFDGRS